MSERIKWIRYKEADILFCDYRGLTGEDYENAIAEQEKAVLNSGKKRVLVLLDTTDSHMSKASTRRAKELEENIKKRGFVVKFECTRLLLGMCDRSFNLRNCNEFPIPEWALPPPLFFLSNLLGLNSRLANQLQKKKLHPSL